jgi:hypothetical protein
VTTAKKLELASAILVVVTHIQALGSPRTAHAHRCGVDLLCVVCAQRFILDVPTCWGLAFRCVNMFGACIPFEHAPAFVHSIASSSFVQCAANCYDCPVAGAGKCDHCRLYSTLTSKRTCAKVWVFFVCQYVGRLQIPLQHRPWLCCTQLPSLFPCSVRRTVIPAKKLAPACAILVVVLRALGSPQNAHAHRCGEICWALCVLNG